MKQNKARSLTPQQSRNAAILTALEEAAGHLELHWTDDKAERAAGTELALALISYVNRGKVPRWVGSFDLTGGKS